VMRRLVDQDILARIRGEYREMPGLTLKAPQVQRLCGVEREVCAHVLDALVKENFLRLKSDGIYVRMFDGQMSDSRVG
jgi:hypothetical protein